MRVEGHQICPASWEGEVSITQKNTSFSCSWNFFYLVQFGVLFLVLFLLSFLFLFVFLTLVLLHFHRPDMTMNHGISYLGNLGSYKFLKYPQGLFYCPSMKYVSFVLINVLVNT